MSKLQELLELGSSDFALNEAKWLIVEVEVEGGTPEIIVNPRENFESKLKYYTKAYNEDLTLKANTNIKIVKFDFVEEISKYFN